MRLPFLTKKNSIVLLILISIIWLSISSVFAQSLNLYGETTINRLNLVTQQITLLQNRLKQSQTELSSLQAQHDKDITQLSLQTVTKRTLDQAALDISVSSSSLDSINIEIADTQQIINWLEKNIQEIENQLNVLSVFGLKNATSDQGSVKELQNDADYQQKLLRLEKNRLRALQKLQAVANNILQLRNDRYNRLNAYLTSQNMLHIKQQQLKDELAYQEKQNTWLNQVNADYLALAKLSDKQASGKEYSEIERNIYYANENASLAYFQSLMARYQDQIVQMNISIIRSNSITLLNEIGDQVQVLNKQLSRLDSTLKNRETALAKHITFLGQKDNPNIKDFVTKLVKLQDEYKNITASLGKLNTSLTDLRGRLDKALQTELSSRRGLPSFTFKTLMDIGKETLLIPALTFHVIKSFTANIVKGISDTTLGGFCLFVMLELVMIFAFLYLRNMISQVLARPSAWRDQINTKNLSLQWLKRNCIDLFVIGNIGWIFYFFNIPQQNYIFLGYIALEWVVLKSLLTIGRICLVETTHDAQGHDIKLYYRLKWILLIGGIITGLTVFVHQLPLIYELKSFFDALFLTLLMVVSLLLLKSSEVIPNLIMPHLESQHPYLQRSIRLIGILIPALMFANSIIGLFGFVNLIMTVSWYEGVFLVVLIGYLILRGLLSDGMEQLSRIMIQYVNNGWLWTEAFLKPLDRVLRITLFLVAWATLFLLYGWDQKSPIVERLTRLLHYQLTYILNTTITPLNIIELFVVISIFYWSAKWTREFVYRLLLSRTKDLGIRNSIAIISQYTVVVVGAFICLRVLGIDLQALAAIAAAFALGVGLGLRDLANNFASGFLLLLERPIRVGDVVKINDVEGEVVHIGGRAVTITTAEHTELLVPNAEIFSKSLTNLTSRDSIVRSVINIKISRYDNPHEVKVIIHNVLVDHKDVLSDPMPEVYLKDLSDTLMSFELRYYVNIRQIESRAAVLSSLLMSIWDEFSAQGIKPPYPQQEIFIRGNDEAVVNLPIILDEKQEKN